MKLKVHTARYGRSNAWQAGRRRTPHNAPSSLVDVVDLLEGAAEQGLDIGGPMAAGLLRQLQGDPTNGTKT